MIIRTVNNGIVGLIWDFCSVISCRLSNINNKFFFSFVGVRVREFYCWKIGTTFSNGCCKTKCVCVCVLFISRSIVLMVLFLRFASSSLFRKPHSHLYCGRKARLVRVRVREREREQLETGIWKQQVSIEVEISYIIFFISFGKFDFWAVAFSHTRQKRCAHGLHENHSLIILRPRDGKRENERDDEDKKNKPCHHSWFSLLYFHFHSTRWFISGDIHNGEIIKRLNVHAHTRIGKMSIYTM